MRAMKTTQTVKAADLARLTKSHENQWVALSGDYKRLVGVAKTLRALRRIVADKDVVVMRVLPANVGYVPPVHA